MMRGYGMDSFFEGWMMIFGVIFWLLIIIGGIVLVYWLIKSVGGTTQAPKMETTEDAIRTLKLRLAKGEINESEYDSLLKKLKEH